MSKGPWIAAVALTALLLPAGASAEWEETEHEAAGSDADHQMPLGNRTRAILERQRSGVDAAPEARGLTPPAERRARMRYLRSFEHPIPDLFDADEAGGPK